MAVEKQLNSRIILKHDTEANWNLAINFIPKAGEMIIYDIDENHTDQRIKIGDGITPVTQLSFYNYITPEDVDEICAMTISTWTGGSY